MAFRKRRKTNTSYDNPEALFRDRRNRTVQGLLSHQSDILRRYADEALDKPNIAIELPTGSGKTLVGLLIGEFRRVTRNERILYLCPTKQLVLQVCEQSERKYGIVAIPFTGKVKDYSPSDKSRYQTGKAVAVAPYSALFNTNPFFDSPQTIILDDAHASENYIASTWSLNISRHDHDRIYFGLLGILEKFLPSLYKLRFRSSEPDKSKWIEKIPAAYFVEDLTQIHAFLNENIQPKTSLCYPWSFLEKNLKSCCVYVSYNEILIRPYIPPSLTHKPFADATQKVFMSATLGLGGDLERITGIPTLHRLEIPDGWDKQGIGRRYFVFPELSLSAGAEVDTLTKAMIGRAGRALVLVPNDKKIEKYKSLLRDFSVYNAQDIEMSKDEFISREKSVAVLANRYDGIDLLDDDCRLLVIEGLPKAGNLQELFFVTRMLAGNLFKDRIRTRIVQAFGRCTRSATDYAAVIVIGEDFPDWLVLSEKRSLFHPELQGELIFGVEQSGDRTLDEFLENLDIFLNHESDWDEVDADILEYRDRTSQVPIPGQDKLLEAAKYEVDYLYALWNEDYEKCLELSQHVANILSGDNLKGLRGFWYYSAASVAELAFRKFKDQVFITKSIDLYKRASNCLPALDWLRILPARLSKGGDPLIKDNGFLDANIERMENLFETSSFTSLKRFEETAKSILDGLNSNDSKQFEEAHRQLGELLGFDSGNSDGQNAPDPWWISNERLCIVFEDKSDATSETISVKYAKQAAGHPKWIRENLPLALKADIYSVIIAPQSKIDREVPIFAENVGWWDLKEFRGWASDAMSVLRELRSKFTGAGQQEWRDLSRETLQRNSLDPKSIVQRVNQKLLRNLEH